MARSIRPIVTGNSLAANHGRIRIHSPMLRGTGAQGHDRLVDRSENGTFPPVVCVQQVKHLLSDWWLALHCASPIDGPFFGG